MKRSRTVKKSKRSPKRAETNSEEALWSNLEAILPEVLPKLRWFGGKARKIRAIEMVEKIPFSNETVIALMLIKYTAGAPDTYALPLRIVKGSAARMVKKRYPQSVLSAIRSGKEFTVIQDATWDDGFRADLLKFIFEKKRLKASAGGLISSLTRHARSGAKLRIGPRSEVLKGEQSNTSINYGNRFVLKLFRRLEEGVNPDVEIGRFLTDHTDFRNAPLSIATLEYLQPDSEPITLASVQAFVPNEGDAWKVFMKRLSRFCKKRGTLGLQTIQLPMPSKNILEASKEPFPKEVTKYLEPFLSMAELLGKRTIEMHIALASRAGANNSDFEPEPFTLFYQRALYQSMREQADRTLDALRVVGEDLPESVQREMHPLLAAKSELYRRFDQLLENKVNAMRTRTHGDFHLGQVLYTGKDFVIIDFEGEPARSLSERKFKRSALRDVAGMLRSFHYASHVAGHGEYPSNSEMEHWLEFWHSWVCVAYLKGYFGNSGSSDFLPESTESIQMLLDIYLLEKALYELTYEINNRPEWVKVPLSGILKLLEAKTS